MAKRRGSFREKRTTDLGEYLTFKRLEEGLTQEQIAKRLRRSRSCICRIERGQRNSKCLRGYILYQLAEAYDAPVDVVLEKANWPQLLLIDIDRKKKKQLASYIKKNL
ncbi:MAG: helix-turn-helix domain-containing protein [Dehalococcoidia bacterium]|nr:helix-turn-helix domain-containing protein [Dehalococcoidia bacterium]